jgi:cytochrome c-type biogenesis protein CcmE
MNVKYIIGGLIIVVFLIWGATAFLNTTVQYVSITEAKDASRMVQVMGKIDFDRVDYNAEESRLEFAIFDADADSPVGSDDLNIVYYGVVPGNFDQATSVVVKGKPENGEFVADQILVKCPSKYQGEGGEEFQDVRKHQQANEEEGI